MAVVPTSPSTAVRSSGPAEAPVAPARPASAVSGGDVEVLVALLGAELHRGFLTCSPAAGAVVDKIFMKPQ